MGEDSPNSPTTMDKDLQTQRAEFYEKINEILDAQNKRLDSQSEAISKISQKVDRQSSNTESRLSNLEENLRKLSKGIQEVTESIQVITPSKIEEILDQLKRAKRVEVETSKHGTANHLAWFTFGLLGLTILCSFTSIIYLISQGYSTEIPNVEKVIALVLGSQIAIVSAITGYYFRNGLNLDK